MCLDVGSVGLLILSAKRQIRKGVGLYSPAPLPFQLLVLSTSPASLGVTGCFAYQLIHRLGDDASAATLTAHAAARPLAGNDDAVGFLALHLSRFFHETLNGCLHGSREGFAGFR